jgi:hypothetical protein
VDFDEQIALRMAQARIEEAVRAAEQRRALRAASPRRSIRARLREIRWMDPHHVQQ